LGSTPAAPPGFGVQAETELFGGFDGSDIGSGFLLTHRASVLVGSGLCEHTSEFDLAGVGRLALDFAAAIFGLGLHDRYGRAIHFDVEEGHCGSAHLGQFQLLGAANRGLLASFDIVADGLAWRSTALAVTSIPASNSSCSRPCSKLVSLPTTAILRRTPGEYAVPTTSSSASRGLCPW